MMIEKIQEKILLVEKEIAMYEKANNVEMISFCKGERDGLLFALNLIEKEVGSDEEN